MGCSGVAIENTTSGKGRDRCNFQGIGMQGGVLLVEQGSYYKAVDDDLARMPERASLAQVRPYLEQLSIAIREAPVSQLRFFHVERAQR